MEFSPNGVRRADIDGQMWGSRGERKQGCSKTWRKLGLAGVQCMGSGVLSLGGRGTVYSKGSGGPWKGKSLCFIFFVDFSLKLVFFRKAAIYLIFGCAGSSLLRGLLFNGGERASHGGGFSCCRAWAPGLLGLRSCGSWALEHRLNCCGTWA